MPLISKQANKLTNAFIRSRFLAQNGRCFYCETELALLTPKGGQQTHDGRPCWTDDHFIPRAKGGPKDWSNKVIACLKCNHDKGNRMPTDEERAKFAALNHLNPPTEDVLSRAFPAPKKKRPPS